MVGSHGDRRSAVKVTPRGTVTSGLVRLVGGLLAHLSSPALVMQPGRYATIPSMHAAVGRVDAEPGGANRRLRFREK